MLHSRLILTLVLVFITQQLLSQSQDWQWAHNAGGTNWDFGNDVATDRLGNVYVTGYFASDSATFGNVVLENSGNAPYEECFLAKYDPFGNLVWVKRAGGVLSDVGQSVATDATGNVYLAGFFRSSSISFDAITLPLSGDYNIFLVKFDPDGNAQWGTSGTTVDFNYAYCSANGLAIDASGNVLLAGDFGAASITFGVFTLNNTANDGSGDLFVAKFDAGGNAVWASSAQGDDYDGCLGTATDSSGSVYVSGFYRSSSLEFANDTLYNFSGADLFIAKYDSNGNELWVESADGDNDDYGRDVAVDNAGNLYLTGEFYSSSLTFGNTTVNNSLASGYADLFLTKYNSLGEVQWVRKANALYYDYSYGVATDTSGGVYITGTFDSNITFDTITLTAQNSEDIFIAKYDTAGNFILAYQALGNNADYSYKIATDAFGNIFLTGGFSSDTIRFGDHKAPDSYYNAYMNSYDIIVAKFGANNCANVFYADMDQDEYGDLNNSVIACKQPPGFVTDSTDCNDGNAAIYPGAYDIPGNGIDEDCDGTDAIGVGMTNATTMNSMLIYPNPSTGKFVVVIPQSITGETTIELLNVLGSVEWKEEINFSDFNGQYEIKLDQQIAAGVYTLRIHADKVLIAHVMVQKI
ncbi:MAG TPA: SBBP repeat-containing protein [Chitinophagales bacterium]|nr:SBBP repeat-containing protein [Chitinophagales bacterium]